MEDHDKPRPKEGGGRGVEPAGPVHNEEVEGGQLTEHLGSKVGGEAIGTTGTLLVHYHTLRRNWLGDKPLNPALLRWCNKFKTQAYVSKCAYHCWSI